jgi:D-alanine-D-alanine ligase
VRVLVLYTLPPESPGPQRTVAEFELSGAAAFVARALRGAAVRAVHGRPLEILEVLREINPDVVFNLCEAPLGRPDLEAHVASFLEWAGIRFAGCGSETLTLCRRKDLTTPVLRAAGIGVPQDVDPANPSFPCVVKPAAEDGSAGIHDHSLCHNAEQLRYALSQLTQPGIVQEFVPGREFSVSLWGRSHPDFSSIGETTREQGGLITYATKWQEDRGEGSSSQVRHTAGLDADLQEAILKAARAAWKAVGARHALRIDVRLDQQGAPRVLDVNPNPAISPVMGICRAVQEAGWRWETFVTKLVEWA